MKPSNLSRLAGWLGIIAMAMTLLALPMSLRVAAAQAQQVNAHVSMAQDHHGHVAMPHLGHVKCPNCPKTCADLAACAAKCAQTAMQVTPSIGLSAPELPAVAEPSVAISLSGIAQRPPLPPPIV